MTEPIVIKDPRFSAQGLLFGAEDLAALHCEVCGFTFDVPVDWLRDHVGERSGCPECGCVGELCPPIGA
jgi:hypothetical protein